MAGLAQAQTSPFAPNGIVFVDNTSTLSTGTAQNITVQILYEGGPLKSEGVRVYILSNDTSIVPAEMGTYVLTDPNGIATYTVTAGKAGNVKLTISAGSATSGVSTERVFQVTSGPVATPTATVTATPSPSATAEPTTTPTATPTVEPTVTPTVEPTLTPTAVPTATPEPGNSEAQATGIIVTGIVLAIVILLIVGVAQQLRKK